MKKQRQATIVKRIKSGVVTSQLQLVEMLRRDGFRVSQTSVSRDLKELGIAKGRDCGGTVRYGEPAGFQPAAQTDAEFKRMAAGFLLTAEASGNLVVVKTSPGNAQGLAAALDAAALDGTAGTVAGDDVILVVCSEGFDSRKVKKKLLSYAVDQG